MKPLFLGISFATLFLLMTARPASCSDRFIDRQLFTAAEDGSCFLIKLLLLIGADPNARQPVSSDRSYTTLMAAASSGHVEAVKLLLEHGADPKLIDKDSQTALTLGLSNLAVVKMLVEKGADVNAQPVLGGKKAMTPLITAAADGKKETVQYLLEHGADPMIRTDSNKSALDVAEKLNFPEVIRLLSDHIAKRQATTNAVTDGPGIPHN